MTIGDVAKRVGIRPSTIRYYEQIGLLPPPPRVSGCRRYDEAVLDRLAVIRVAREAGFTLTEAKTLFRGFDSETVPPARWGPSARRKHREMETLIARGRHTQRVLSALLTCTCTQFEECGRIIRDRVARGAVPRGTDPVGCIDGLDV